MKDYDVYLNMILTDYKRRLEKERKELQRLPEGKLGFRISRGKMNFVHLLKDNEGKLLRKGITKNEQLVSMLARKKFLEVSTALIREEISRLEAFMTIRTEPTVQNILDLLSYGFQQIDEELFFPERKHIEKWAADDFKKNSLFSEKKIYISTKGLRMRSKSELLIAEKLDSYGIPYRYDQVISINGFKVSPDFSFRTEDEPLYWEHNGMMENPEYRRNNKYKMGKYEKMGIVPWDNLIVTYDKIDGGIDLMEVDEIIRRRLL